MYKCNGSTMYFYQNTSIYAILCIYEKSNYSTQNMLQFLHTDKNIKTMLILQLNRVYSRIIYLIYSNWNLSIWNNIILGQFSNFIHLLYVTILQNFQHYFLFFFYNKNAWLYLNVNNNIVYINTMTVECFYYHSDICRTSSCHSVDI